MNWILLTAETQIQQIVKQSATRPQVIFKHSTRCAVSSMSKNRLERNYQPGNIDFYFLDLLTYRSLSHKVEGVFNVAHESPQVLLIKNGICVYDESHSGITMDEIIEQSERAN
ncbi:MAG: bacillithiol system redox-active protein YtxJ [Chitinophagaceae bacterium]